MVGQALVVRKGRERGQKSLPGWRDLLRGLNLSEPVKDAKYKI